MSTKRKSQNQKPDSQNSQQFGFADWVNVSSESDSDEPRKSNNYIKTVKQKAKTGLSAVDRFATLAKTGINHLRNSSVIDEDPNIEREYDLASVSFHKDLKQLTGQFTSGASLLKSGIHPSLLNTLADRITTVYDKILSAPINPPIFTEVDKFLEMDPSKNIYMFVLTYIDDEDKIVEISKNFFTLIYFESVIVDGENPNIFYRILDAVPVLYEEDNDNALKIVAEAENGTLVLSDNIIGLIEEIAKYFKMVFTENEETGEITVTWEWNEEIANNLVKENMLESLENMVFKKYGQPQAGYTTDAKVYKVNLETGAPEIMKNFHAKSDIGAPNIMELISQLAFGDYEKFREKTISKTTYSLQGIPPSATQIADQKRLARLDKAQRHLTGISISEKNQEEANEDYKQWQDLHKKDPAATAAADTEAPKRNPFLEALDARRKAEAKAKEEELGGSLKKTKTKKKRSKGHKKTKKHMNKKTNKRRKHRSNKSKKHKR